MTTVHPLLSLPAETLSCGNVDFLNSHSQVLLLISGLPCFCLRASTWNVQQSLSFNRKTAFFGTMELRVTWTGATICICFSIDSLQRKLMVNASSHLSHNAWLKRRVGRQTFVFSVGKTKMTFKPLTHLRVLWNQTHLSRGKQSAEGGILRSANLRRWLSLPSVSTVLIPGQHAAALTISPACGFHYCSEAILCYINNSRNLNSVIWCVSYISLYKLSSATKKNTQMKWLTHNWAESFSHLMNNWPRAKMASSHCSLSISRLQTPSTPQHTTRLF